MKTLHKILLLGSIFGVASCNGKTKNSQVLTPEQFSSAEWIKAPFSGEIWSSYMGERISRSMKNLKIYQDSVAARNGFSYELSEDGKRIIRGFYPDSIISLPDIDSTRYVVSGKDTIRTKKQNTQNSFVSETY